MKSLQDYMIGLNKAHTFKVRTLFDVSEAQIQMLEEFMEKYDLINVTAPKKTMFVKNAIGFEQPVSSEVIIFDLTLGLPASSFVLRQEISTLFDQPVVNVSVMSEQEESPQVQDSVDDLNANIEPQILSAIDLYGDEYNADMLNKLKTSRDQITQTLFKKQ